MARREIYQLGYHFIQNQLSRRDACDALLSLPVSHHRWPRYTYVHVNQPHGNGRRARILCLTALHCICSPFDAPVSLSSRACRSRSQSSNRYIDIFCPRGSLMLANLWFCPFVLRWHVWRTHDPRPSVPNIMISMHIAQTTFRVLANSYWMINFDYFIWTPRMLQMSSPSCLCVARSVFSTDLLTIFHLRWLKIIEIIPASNHISLFHFCDRKDGRYSQHKPYVLFVLRFTRVHEASRSLVCAPFQENKCSKMI